MTKSRGTTHPQAKLTDAQVRSILAYGNSKSKAELARMFGVCPASITNILLRKTWAHVQP